MSKKPKAQKQPEHDLDDEIVLSCAMRYALGRRTYVVSAVTSKLRAAYSWLPDGKMEHIAKEIQEHQDEYGMAGMDFDDAEWNKVKWLFDKSNRVRIMANRYKTDIWEEHVAAKGGGKYWSIPDMNEYHTVKEINDEQPA